MWPFVIWASVLAVYALLHLGRAVIKATGFGAE